MSRARAALAILAITALSFFVFPGHTYLEQDTQIYVPILENQWSGALAGDLIVQHPHVNFTFYDELTNGLRWVTRLPLEVILEGEQFAFRAAGFLGIFLVAGSFGLDWSGATLVTALWALGATIKAPAVLTVEYEPTPRSFAVPLLLLAVGLTLRQRFQWAGVAAAGAVLLHAPSTWPYFVVGAVFMMVRRSAWAVLAYPLLALGILAAVGSLEPAAERQGLLGRLLPDQEALQQMRASYVYVSSWWADWAGQYGFFAATAIFALWRLRPTREQWIWLGGLTAAGILSVALSWVLLERFQLAIGPQVQPARALLFVTGIAVLAAGVAGYRALDAGRRIEAAIWVLFCLLVPAHAVFFEWPGWRPVAVLVVCAMALVLLPPRYRVVTALVFAPVLAYGAGAVAAHSTNTRDLGNLAQWARVQARGVYLFPQAGRDHDPGWFRATALQPVYVDWKGGGQVNYLRGFSSEWSKRWNAVAARGERPENFADLKIDYVVYRHAVKISRPLVFHNASWWVYYLGAHTLDADTLDAHNASR